MSERGSRKPLGRAIAGSGMIVRHRHNGGFTAVPNSIFEEDRLSVEAKGLLGYLLSRPPNWQARHDQLQRKLGIGRKLLKRILEELIAAGYAERDERQGRDECNRFTTLNYIIRDIPTRNIAAAPKPLRPEPLHSRDTGNNKEAIKNDLNKPFSQSLPNEHREKVRQTAQVSHTNFGRHALASGQRPVYVGSKPHQAWLRFRGEDGMPGFIDCVTVDGKNHEVVWMPSLYPPRRGVEDEGEGESF